MLVNLSIKNAPDDVVDRLRERAERHHRSLQGEMLAILEEAVRPKRMTSDRGPGGSSQLGIRSNWTRLP